MEHNNQSSHCIVFLSVKFNFDVRDYKSIDFSDIITEELVQNVAFKNAYVTWKHSCRFSEGRQVTDR